MKALAILLLMSAMTCHAQTAPTIKGHTLGETTQEFTAHADDITRGLISTCVTKSRAYPALKAAADAAAAAYAPYASATRSSRAGRSAYDADSAATYAAANADPSREIGCDDFLTILKTGNGTLNCTDPAMEIGMCRNFSGTVTFAGGKAVEYRIQLWRVSWDDALADSVAKLGKPENAQVTTMQNGYGANLDIHEADWTTPTYMADLCEVPEANLTTTPGFHIVDLAYYKSQQKPRSSSLN